MIERRESPEGAAFDSFFLLLSGIEISLFIIRPCWTSVEMETVIGIEIVTLESNLRECLIVIARQDIWPASTNQRPYIVL
jgi:hypothetical protein